MSDPNEIVEGKVESEKDYMFERKKLNKTKQ